tara:strand:+ start:254 stop:454 length:201 start_codon:yes stop_codon:yes gene_type:complete
MNNSQKSFFKEQTIERLDMLEKSIKNLTIKHNTVITKIDLLIDFLERKEENRGYLLGSWKTEFKKN